MPPPALRSSVRTLHRVRDTNSDPERARLCSRVALGDLAPVHRVPPRFEVIGTAVLVVEIIGVLPHVVAEQYALAVHDRRVLVGPGFDGELAFLGNGDEHPARAELPSAGGIE